MIRIDSLPQYKALLSENKQRFAKVVSNCGLMPASFEPMISEGRLTVKLHDKGLFVFVDEGNYYNLYYFWDVESPLEGLPKGKPILAEILGSENWGAQPGAVEEKLIQSGFRRFKKNDQFVLQLEENRSSIGEEYQRRLAQLNEMGIQIVPCDTASLADKTVALWFSELDPTDIPQEHTQFLVRDNDHVSCAVNRDNEVVAAYWWHIEGKGTGEGRHIVTHKDYLRRGIGTALLLCGQMDLLSRGGKRVITWISDSNTKSIFLHEHVGFQKNGKISTQYIL